MWYQVECANSWIINLRDLNPLAFFDGLVRKMMTKWTESRTATARAVDTGTMFVATAVEAMNKANSFSRHVTAEQSCDGLYLVHWGIRYFFVRLDVKFNYSYYLYHFTVISTALVSLTERSCTFDRTPQLLHLPCEHYLAAMYAQNQSDRDEHRFRNPEEQFVPRFTIAQVVGEVYRASTWKAEYSATITPVIIRTLEPDRRTLPCAANAKKKGRRVVKRKRSAGEDGGSRAPKRAGVAAAAPAVHDVHDFEITTFNPARYGGLQSVACTTTSIPRTWTPGAAARTTTSTAAAPAPSSTAGAETAAEPAVGAAASSFTCPSCRKPLGTRQALRYHVTKNVCATRPLWGRRVTPPGAAVAASAGASVAAEAPAAVAAASAGAEVAAEAGAAVAASAGAPRKRGRNARDARGTVTDPSDVVPSRRSARPDRRRPDPRLDK